MWEKRYLGPSMLAPAPKSYFYCTCLGCMPGEPPPSGLWSCPFPGPLLPWAPQYHPSFSPVFWAGALFPEDGAWVWDGVGVEALCHSLFQQRARVGVRKR